MVFLDLKIDTGPDYDDFGNLNVFWNIEQAFDIRIVRITPLFGGADE